MNNFWNFASLVQCMDENKLARRYPKRPQIAEFLFASVEAVHSQLMPTARFAHLDHETSRKYFGNKPNAIPIRYVQTVSNSAFKVEMLLTDSFSDFLTNFDAPQLTKAIIEQVKLDPAFLTSKHLQNLVETTEPYERFIACCLADALRYRDNRSRELTSSGGRPLSDNERLKEIKRAVSSYTADDADKLLPLFRDIEEEAYLARALIFLAHAQALTESQTLKNLFHHELTKIENDHNRTIVLIEAFSQGYYASHSDALTNHLSEFYGSKELYELLVFLWQKLALYDLVDTAENFLPDKSYVEKIEALKTKKP